MLAHGVRSTITALFFMKSGNRDETSTPQAAFDQAEEAVGLRS
ncbi:hypothetical protein Z949_1773 [Sulfitobacter guttiformis KCTC 32187]|nr:hypothetical protein Z949_1773 [Sulfitobacter guttiformis KCTC 32187]